MRPLSAVPSREESPPGFAGSGGALIMRRLHAKQKNKKSASPNAVDKLTRTA